MKDPNKIKITEGELSESENAGKLGWERIKKPAIYFLMMLGCACCFYLIFKPGNNKIIEDTGLNAGIPQAKDDQLQSDKQKAYEQDLLEKKNEDKKNVMTTLSDYWTDQNNLRNNGESAAIPGNTNVQSYSDQNALNSYRNARQTLHSFYGKDDQQVNDLKKEISRLKNEASQNNQVPAVLGIKDQLELMEKSYQMASRYLPTSFRDEKPAVKEDENQKKEEEKKVIITPVRTVRRSIVSSLYRQSSDSAFMTNLYHNRFSVIQNDSDKQSRSQNVIKGVIHETKVMTSESTISIRLSEAMILGKTEIPAGTVITAGGKFQGGRLQLMISHVVYNGIILPVEINIYDNDGQPGLYVSNSVEQNTVRDIAANMSQNPGTNIMMTQSAGQQVAADLTRGVVQGISGYFQKKIRQPKVTVKDGHQVFLVAKNN